jgi:hypothetical protein
MGTAARTVCAGSSARVILAVMPTLVVVGAGPKGIAIAAKARALAAAGLDVPRVVLVDRGAVAGNWTGRQGYTSGLLPLGTPAEKDVGFPYADSWGAASSVVTAAMADYSWQRHLIAHGVYADWVDRGRLRPTHRQWSSYLREVAEKAAQASRAPNRQSFEQVWFPGVHSDVGGGYDNHELADITLRWHGHLVGGLRVPAEVLNGVDGDLHGALGRMIEQVEDELGARLPDLSREGKQRAVRLLDERGAFLLRRSVEDVADALGVSRITVYNYLNAIPPVSR